MPLLTEVGTYLAAQLTLVRGTTLFEGTLPDRPDVCLAVRDLGGGGPSTLGFGVTTGVQYENPHIQIVVRGKAQDRTTPQATAHLARQALAKVQAMTLTSTLYHFIIPMQSPFLLVVDKADERPVYAFNCRVRKEPS